MKIAVSSEDNQGLEGQVAQHFGRCPYFTFVDVEEGEIQQVRMLENPFFAGHQPGQVPGFIHEQGADMMVAGGMGGRAVQFFQELGVQAFTGASGTIQQALEMAMGGHLDIAEGCAGHSGGACDDHDHEGQEHHHGLGHHHG